MIYGKPIAELIERRFSCCTYATQPIAEETQERLRRLMTSLDAALFGTPLRFELIAATEEDQSTLRGLGTYGFIRRASGFIVGAAGHGAKDLEGFGARSLFLVFPLLD